MKLTLEVPDDIQRAIRIPEGELRVRVLIELASALYQQGLLTFGKAAELSELNQFRFGQELVKRDIPRIYSDEDLGEDLAYASGQ